MSEIPRASVGCRKVIRETFLRPSGRHHPEPAITIPHLPTELLDIIISYIDTIQDLNSLSRASRRTHALAQPFLLRLAASATLRADNTAGYPPNTVLHWAVMHNSPALVHALMLHFRRLQRSPDETAAACSAALLPAVIAPVANCDIITQLLAGGADAARVWGGPDTDGRRMSTDSTPLLAAVRLQRHDVVELLLAGTPQSVITEVSHVWPLHFAVILDDAKMVSVILRLWPESAELRTRTYADCHSVRMIVMTASQLAVAQNKTAALRALKEAGVHVPDEDDKIDTMVYVSEVPKMGRRYKPNPEKDR
ncbi:hypothetical protein EDC01DRAFT_758114 [Geopyxis carbonaria]|nr:hypothetical protein EDC01DRAFT_758114 [Geopyxis carbonaria]